MAFARLLLEDGTSGLLLEDGASDFLLETLEETSEPSPAGQQPAGRPSKDRGKRRRRRIEVDGRMYEVDERDIPALLESAIRRSRPPGTAEVVDDDAPAPKSPERVTIGEIEPLQMPEPISAELVVERFAAIQRELVRQSEQEMLRVLERVAQRVLAEVEDEDEALVALLLT